MSVPSPHNKLDLFATSRQLVVACYALSQVLPPEEKTNLNFYLRNTALKGHVAISQGIFLKKRKAREKSLLQAKNALIIIDTVVDILTEVGFATDEQIVEVVKLSSVCYRQVDDLIKES